MLNPPTPQRTCIALILYICRDPTRASPQSIFFNIVENLASNTGNMKKSLNKIQISDFFEAKTNSYTICLSPRKLLYLAFALLNFSKIWAQGHTLSGVVNEETGTPLPYVSVVLKGTSLRTETDLSGNFNLNLPDNAPGRAYWSFPLSVIKRRK